jgi:tetrahydromethanopterin S-methyltransferase subunit A
MNVLKNDYRNALASQKALTEAVGALHAAMAHIDNKKLRESIVGVIGGIESISATSQEVVDRINKMVANFDKNLINHASNRIHQIDGLLRWNSGVIARKQMAFESRANDSRAQRIPFEQFRPLDAEPTDADRANVAEERAALLEEQKLLHEFLRDGALFDIDRLKSTAIAVYL